MRGGKDGNGLVKRALSEVAVATGEVTRAMEKWRESMRRGIDGEKGEKLPGEDLHDVTTGKVRRDQGPGGYMTTVRFDVLTSTEPP